jgi:uncharacterized damage-inducible protein DinB
MIFKVGIENNVEGRSLAWVLDYPGCFAYGKSESAALQAAPQAIWDYAGWLDRHNPGRSWLEPDTIELNLQGRWEVYSIDENFEVAPKGYEVNAWFQDDWRPLSLLDIERGVQLLSWSREDLIDTVRGLDKSTLEVQRPGERWNIEGILKHVANAEWWYLDRLGLAFPREEVPKDYLERLEAVRAHLFSALPKMAGVKQVVGVDGEFWSPRKLLRRAAWHELDHLGHIRSLLAPLAP